MSDYDFTTLNDKEFEVLCADLVGLIEERQFERFKPGKDAGVDGRYFIEEDKEIVLQCKHWANTPLSQLIISLSKVEKKKLDKLNPHRYILAISNPLSRSDKDKIFAALTPHVKSKSDILGKEDLNDQLRRYPKIEQRHYKLWLTSAKLLQQIANNAVLGRSQFSVESILESSLRYVRTENHDAAKKQLEKLGVVIIMGEPGVGKTTLAEHLCLDYLAQDFDLITIAERIDEAESLFDHESKQLFYFDDFLGRNYLLALTGHEGNHITQFIKRVSKNKNKRFILTSRSTILNQGKTLIDSFEINNLRRNEYELQIKSLSTLDKAKILYNHIWYSCLAHDYVEELYFEKRYRKIIEHRNFNPRLINFITDNTRLESCPANQYWNHISQSLSNPSQIWENPFVAQQDDFSRSIVILVVMNGRQIDEQDLKNAYERYIGFPENQTFQGRRDFQNNLKHLTGSLLNRKVDRDNTVSIDLFNPSIGDFVLSRHRDEMSTIKKSILSLKTSSSLRTLRDLSTNGLITKENTFSICEALLNDLSFTEKSIKHIQYLALVCNLFIDCIEPSKQISHLFKHAVKEISKYSCDGITIESFKVVEFSFTHGILKVEDVVTFLDAMLPVVCSDEEIHSFINVLNCLSDTTQVFLPLKELFNQHVLELIQENLDEFIDVNEAFNGAGWDDSELAEEQLLSLIQIKLDEFQVTYNFNNRLKIMESIEIEYRLQKYIMNSSDGGDQYSPGSIAQGPDAVDDLFDRG
ncbi:restriction endonuclease [Undibacterium sp. MH2W]|uniref:nSTAND3 domain-containing NTPase n=1 Tax=Undibacterium sp. MH2W TaxID=3413044 RepID=UPI003BF2B8AF